MGSGTLLSTVRRRSDVLLERDGPIAHVSLNRPGPLNAFDTEMLVRFNEVLRECETDDSIRVVVVSGNGLSFCAGIDLTALASGDIPRSFFSLWEETMWLSEALPKPVICAVHGNCIGAGLQFALTCDLRVAERSARFALPAAKEGLIPSLSPHRLQRFVGLGRARRMVLFDEKWSAPDAYEYGLVDELVETAGPVRPAGDSADARTRAELAGAQRKAVVEHAVQRAHSLAVSLPTISFAKCKKALGLERHPEADRLESYLRDQEDCLNHPDHQRAAEEWMARSAAKAGKAS